MEKKAKEKKEFLYKNYSIRINNFSVIFSE